MNAKHKQDKKQLQLFDQLPLPEHSTSRFSYDAERSLFMAEASELTEGSRKQLFGKLADSEAQGFVLVSHKTGDKVTFAVHRIDTSGDDIAGWYLVPHEYTSKTSGLRVLIIND